MAYFGNLWATSSAKTNNPSNSQGGYFGSLFVTPAASPSAKSTITVTPTQKTITQLNTPKKTQTTFKASPGLKLNLTDSPSSNQSAKMTITKKSLEQQQRSVDQMNKVTNFISDKANKNFPATTQAFTHLFDQTFDPKGAWNDFVNSFKEPLKEEKKRIVQYFNDYGKNALKPQNLIGINTFGLNKSSKQTGQELQVITGGANVLFSPITALFAGANKIPVLGTISRAISIPFSLAGEGAAAASGKLIDVLPIPAQDKQNLKQGVMEISALAAQLLLAKAGSLKEGKTAEIGDISTAKRTQLIQKYGLQDAITIETKAKELATQQAKSIDMGKTYSPDEIIQKVVDSPLENTPEGKALIKAATEAKRTGKNVSVGTIPQIERLGTDTPVFRGAKVHEIDTARPNGITGGVSFSTDKAVAERFAQNEGGTVKKYTISKDATIVNHSALEGMTQAERNQFLKTYKVDAVRFDIPKGAQGEAEIRVLNNRVLRTTEEAPKITQESINVKKTPSKIGLSIERKAVESGISKKFEGVAGYDKITIKDQAARATDLLTKDFEQARRIIRGEEDLPANLRGTALISAMEEHIKKTGDGTLAQELANSPLVSRTSAAAQELRLAAEREPDSLAVRLRQLRDAKEEGLKKRTGQKPEEAIKKEVDQIKVKVKKPDKYDWKNFIDTIEC